MCNSETLMDFIKYWPVQSFEIAINRNDHLLAILYAVENQIIGKIKIFNIIGCTDYKDFKDLNHLLVYFLVNISAYEIQNLLRGKNNHSVKFVITYDVVIQDETVLDYLNKFFTAQHNRISAGYMYNYHVIIQHLAIETIDFTHNLFDVIPKKYLRSLRCDLSGITLPNNSTHVSRIFHSLSKFKNLRYLMLPNIPHHIESRTSIISAMEKFNYIGELNVSCNTINPLMLCNILANLKSNITKLRLFNVNINDKCLDVINTSCSYKMLKTLQLSHVGNLNACFTTLLELLSSKLHLLEEFHVRWNDLSMEQHKALLKVYPNMNNITMLDIVEPSLKFEKHFQELLLHCKQIVNRFKI